MTSDFSYQMPERIEQAQRILGIPFKRTGNRPIDYLEYDEICAVLSSIDRTRKCGLRDYTLLACSTPAPGLRRPWI
jgi:hypothetical protein